MSAARKIREVSETAALYATGGLSPDEVKRFDQRLQSGCPFCNAELEDCQRAVEGLLLSCASVTPSTALEARLMERIGREPRDMEGPKSGPEITRSDQGSWAEALPGVHVKMLKGQQTLMVRMEKGASYPSHAHAYDEQCIVMEGSIEDTEGNIARAGDFVFMAKGSTHPELFSKTGALFLVAYT
jgi:anti-sigma factor ChrR (cupin superfamily)